MGWDFFGGLVSFLNVLWWKVNGLWLSQVCARAMLGAACSSDPITIYRDSFNVPHLSGDRVFEFQGPRRFGHSVAALNLLEHFPRSILIAPGWETLQHTLLREIHPSWVCDDLRSRGFVVYDFTRTRLPERMDLVVFDGCFSQPQPNHACFERILDITETYMDPKPFYVVLG